MKICIDCNQSKELKDFHKSGYSRKTNEPWYRNRCKKCHNAKFLPPTGKENTGRFKKGHIPSNPFKKGNIPWTKGRKVSIEERERLSKLQLGRKASLETREKLSKAHTKNWDEYKSYTRHSAANRRWSKEVRKRDNFTCQYCKNVEGRLFAHHIKSWKDYPDLRFEISNGITLCEKCHLKEHENDPSRKNLPLWSKGRKFTMEHKLKLSNAHKGKIPWNKGLKMSKKLETVV